MARTTKIRNVCPWQNYHSFTLTPANFHIPLLSGTGGSTRPLTLSKLKVERSSLTGKEKMEPSLLQFLINSQHWGVGSGGGGWTALQKKKHFWPQNDKFGCILSQFLTSRKYGSLRTRILRFNREITKLTKTVPKLSKNSRSNQGAVAPSPPEYATGGDWGSRVS